MEITPVEAIVKKYLSFLRRAEKQEISWKKAVILVGGEKRLESLMEQGKIRFFKPEGARNTKWRFNLADIVKNTRTDSRIARLSVNDTKSIAHYYYRNSQVGTSLILSIYSQMIILVIKQAKYKLIGY